MIVVDASAVVDALIEGRRSETVRRHLELADRVVAPELLFVEAVSAMWRLVRADAIPEPEAERAVSMLAELSIEGIPHRALMPHAWSLRESVRISDAFYLACAAQLRTSLLSTDARLARGHHGVPVTLVT